MRGIILVVCPLWHPQMDISIPGVPLPIISQEASLNPGCMLRRFGITRVYSQNRWEVSLGVNIFITIKATSCSYCFTCLDLLTWGFCLSCCFSYSPMPSLFPKISLCIIYWNLWYNWNVILFHPRHNFKFNVTSKLYLLFFDTHYFSLLFLNIF